MVGKMVLGQKILTGLLIGGGSGWLVSPHSHQLEARLPWGGVLNSSQATSYARSNFELPCGELLVEGPRAKPCSISSRYGSQAPVDRTSLEDPCFGGKGLTKSGVTAMAGFDGSGVTSWPVLGDP